MEHQHGKGNCVYAFHGWMTSDYWDKHIYRDKPMESSKDEELVAGTWSYEEGGIAKREDSELIVALINNLPQILAALRKP